jgi:hypothetical protein
MAVHRTSAVPSRKPDDLSLTRVAVLPRLRVLAWDRDALFAARGYDLLRGCINPKSTSTDTIEWQHVGCYRPVWWRNLSAASQLGFRLCRDGFHALAVLSTGQLVAAVPGAIVTLAPGATDFRASHKVLRGTRPLHIAVVPQGHIYWGEYFDNPRRDEVHIYASRDGGAAWDVAYTFPPGAIRHVHNIVYDEWVNSLWIFTGDNGKECRILRASCDFRNVDVVLSGNQQARSVACVPTADGLYFSSDTPFEANHVYHLDHQGNLSELGSLNSSSIYGCRVGESIFFSTRVEPSEVNRDRNVYLYGYRNGQTLQPLLHWKKDIWPMALFQYGNAILPDGSNTSGLLAATTIAIQGADLETSLWRINA